MARIKSFNQEKIQDKRKQSGLNQSVYWKRFGVTQSGGSRYETGRNIPASTAMLIWLFESGRIAEQDLADALKAIKK